MANKPDAKGVDAVERALSILDSFDVGHAELTLADLARLTGLYKSTILRLAVSLERFGYLVRMESGHFRLGPAVWRLGSTYRSGFQYADAIRPELKKLSDETQETASFYVREGDRRVCLFRSEPTRAIRHSVHEGVSLPLHKGASGHVLLAWSQSLEEREQYGAEGAELRAKGHAVSMGEREPEVAAIAVPVYGVSGRLVGALSISGLITRIGSEQRTNILKALETSQRKLRDQLIDE